MRQSIRQREARCTAVIKFFEKYIILRGLYEDKDPNNVVISFDEKAKIAIKEYSGSVYTKEKKVFYPSKQKVKGLLEMPAGLNIKTGKVHTCIELPSSLQIEGNQQKEVTFHIDPSRINLVWMVQETVKNSFNLNTYFVGG